MIEFFALIGFWVVGRKLYGFYNEYFVVNRDGNSGRYKHWTEK